MFALFLAFFTSSDSTAATPSPVQSTNQRWFEFLLGGGFQLAVLIWLCILSLLSLALCACLLYVRHHQRRMYLARRCEVTGPLTHSTPASPTSPGQPETILAPLHLSPTLYVLENIHELQTAISLWNNFEIISDMFSFHAPK